MRAKRTTSGADYWAINPKGAVPALDLGDGQVLTENAAILQFLGDLSGNATLLPPVGDLQRYRVLEWLNFIATELHKGFGLLWNPASSDEAKQGARDLLAKNSIPPRSNWATSRSRWARTSRCPTLICSSY